MRQYHLLGAILGNSIGLGISASLGASLGAIAVVQPAQAQSTAITNVEVISSGGGIQLVLQTSGGEAPQVFTINRGNDVVADLVNTTLNLREGGSFRQNNPAPGIASIVVTPLDSNSVRVIVSGNGSAPNVDIAERSPSRITINYGTGVASAPVTPPPPGANPPPMAQEQPRPIAQQPQQPQQPQSEPEVLVRNPEITINGVPVPSTGTSQAPPFLPRAVAPPVGDIAVSNTDASPNLISLGSSEMIQSLVFKDTPVREALSVVARLAGVNVAYAAAGNTTSAQEVGELTINLDIENESLENVFNYILQLSGLEANRVGNTVFVGVNLPNSARDMVLRTIRVNQITARDAGFYLGSLGAETAIRETREQTQTIAVPIPGTDQFRQETTTNLTTVIESLTVEESRYLNPILRGLQVVVDERANNLTLSGPRRLVEIASGQLVSLDIRKRQVAVNVKIIDVNLNNEDTFNTSFSFGINDSFFVSDGGSAAINFGGINPPTGNTVTNRLDGALNLVPPVVTNPYSGVVPFSDGNSQIRVPLTAPGNGGSFLRPIAPLVNEANNLFQPGISEYTSFSLDPGDTTLESLQLGEATFALPTLFEYPTKFLALLQAQVVSRNAKILTDPTVVIQEGQNASVSLTEEVIGNIERETEFGDGFSRTTTTAEIKDAGLQLGITVDRIDDNGFVTMRIIPNVRSIAGTQNFGDTEITLLAERSLDSGTIRLRDGQTLILSGIIQEQERTTVTKWPILGDLPIIGSLFRGSTSENQRAEVIVLVTPQILDDSDRSGYGYGYVPGQDAQEMMNRSR